MTALRFPTDLETRYEQFADDLDGFDGADELARYVLDAAADEIARGNVADEGANRADDDVVEDRLEQLGYLEK